MTRRSGKKKTSTGALTHPLANKTESLDQAAEALKESELKYRTLFEETRDAAVLTSEEGKFLAANRVARKLFGIKTKRDLSDSSMSEGNSWPGSRRMDRGKRAG